MYQQYFGLEQNPFNVTADPNFLFFSRRHQEAFSQLLYGIKERKGFLAITGEIGTGKTTLCRALLNSLGENTKTALILNPSLSKLELLQTILQDFGISWQNNSTLSLLNILYKFLLKQLSLGNNVVLIIDEAQNLRMHLLEQIRLLSNLETEKEKLLQIVLVGQPQLRQKLERPSLRQLRQRIIVRYHILGLDQDEIAGYIKHRLNVAGSNGRIKFTEQALDEIYRYTQGTPRLINIVCDKALLAGYVYQNKIIDQEMLKECIQELEGNTN
ncbi:MAG: AAA family ATPase [Candidatus Omnitrophica bacterium]|nr:AAA family ATPase [Candidatus Omnitrophota bacterium]